MKQKLKRNNIWSILPRVSFVVAVFFMISSYFLRSKLLFISFWIFCFVLTPLFVIINNIFAVIKNKIFLKPFIHICISLVVIFFFASSILPYLYTAPCLTKRKLLVYNEFIELLKKHERFNKLELAAQYDHLLIDEDFFMLDSDKYRIKLKDLMDESEINRFVKISQDLHEIHCHKAVRENNVVLFITSHVSSHPKSYGVLYSLNGENPNNINSELLNPKKPFILLANNWYTSENPEHMSVKSRSFLPFPEKSLIDNTLKVNISIFN